MDLKEVRKHGQSLWLDFMRRDLLTGGGLARLVKDDGITGVTTNPTIFEKAIAGSTLYDASLERHLHGGDVTAAQLYELLAIEDIQQAADGLRPAYDASNRRDGYLNIEVSPLLAHDTAGTVDEGRRLWREVGRENLMVKVPGTDEGFPAIEQLIGEGINVNVTLLFSRAACDRVFQAYVAGLESMLRHGKLVDGMASVASVFVSRIDAKVDPQIEARAEAASGDARSAIRRLVGKVAIANARLAYQDWKARCGDPRWQALAKQGAAPQRLLWASTGTKNPRLRDVLYVESLIGPDTIDTVPPATLEAMRDHGTVESRLEQGVDEAREVVDALSRAGISLDTITRQLVDEGVASFSSAFEKLLVAIEAKRQAVLARRARRPIDDARSAH